MFSIFNRRRDPWKQSIQSPNHRNLDLILYNSHSYNYTTGTNIRFELTKEQLHIYVFHMLQFLKILSKDHFFCQKSILVLCKSPEIYYLNYGLSIMIKIEVSQKERWA